MRYVANNDRIGAVDRKEIGILIMTNPSLCKALLSADSIEIDNEEFFRHFNYESTSDTLELHLDTTDTRLIFNSNSLKSAVYKPADNAWQAVADNGTMYTISLFNVSRYKPTTHSLKRVRHGFDSKLSTPVTKLIRLTSPDRMSRNIDRK